MTWDIANMELFYDIYLMKHEDQFKRHYHMRPDHSWSKANGPFIIFHILNIADYQKRVDECKGKIEKAKAESTADAEQEHLQNELEEKLQSERLLRQELR